MLAIYYQTYKLEAYFKKIMWGIVKSLWKVWLLMHQKPFFDVNFFSIFLEL